MMRGVRAPVHPVALRYARRHSGRDEGEIEKKFPRINDWENKRSRPTMAEAEQLAKFYRRPLLFLYLREIPEDMEDPKAADFRRGKSNKSGEFSVELRHLLRLADERQRWAREFLEESPESGRFSPPGDFGSKPRDAEILGQKIREWLGVDENTLGRISRRGDALEYWRKLAEAQGVIVLQSGGSAKTRINRNEFSGCAMADKAAPVVVLNRADTDARRMFTLAHELAHLWISKPEGRKFSVFLHDNIDDVEIFGDRESEDYCDFAAAAALLPRDTFEERWEKTAGNAEKKVAAITRAYKVSNSAAARRAEKMGFITQTERVALQRKYYGILREKERKKEERRRLKKSVLLAARKDSPSNKKPSKPAKPSGKPALRHFGEYFSALTLDAYEQGAISALDVGALVDIKLDAMSDMAKQLDFPLHRWSR